MFKFDFNVENNDNEDGIFPCKDNSITEKPTNSDVGDDVLQCCYESNEIFPTPENIENLGLFKLNSTYLNVGTNKIYFIKSGNLIKTLVKVENIMDLKRAESDHSDLIPGIYEGGAKLWECTDDLIKYFIDNCPVDYFKNKSVLDLGCGSGLLGIYAMKLEATKVHFQDYNKDVLDMITIPNVLINKIDPKLNEISENIKFFSGDWCKYTNLTRNKEKFDVILTSETIYNPLNQQKLLDTFDVKLQENGIILLAAKIYYFGVGGGLRQFEELIKMDERFVSKVVWTSINGICREILEIKRRSM